MIILGITRACNVKKKLKTVGLKNCEATEKPCLSSAAEMLTADFVCGRNRSFALTNVGRNVYGTMFPLTAAVSFKD